MKNIRIIYILMVVLTFACTKPSELHQEWIETGEQIYAPKPQEMNALAGYGRLVLSFGVYNAVNIEQILIEYDSISTYYSFEDYLTDYATITTEDGVDTLVNVGEELPGWSFFEIDIDNLEEKAYTFYISCIDVDGNSSLIQQVSGTSYGDFYISNLQNRDVEQIDNEEDLIVIHWGNVLENSIGTELQYTNSEGVVQDLMLLPENLQDTIKESSVLSVKFRALYLPEASAVDTFYTDWDVLF